MTKKVFMQILQRNCDFVNKSEKNTLVNHYDEIIKDLMDSGLSEEQAVATFNIDQIIKECHLNKNISHSDLDYTSRMKNQSIQKDFKVYTLAIALCLLVPMIFLTVFLFQSYYNHGAIDFLDYGTRWLVLLAFLLAFSAFFITMEIYSIFRIASFCKLKGKKIGIKQILLFILIHFIASGFTIGFAFLTVAEKWFILLILVFVLLLPYPYFIYKKIKINKMGNKGENYDN